MKKRTFILLGTVIALGAAGWFAYSRTTANRAATASGLQTAVVERGAAVARVDAAGTLLAPRSATLVWGTNGAVGRVHVQVGDRVQAGQVLMELDPSSLDPSVIQAQVDLVNAQASLDELLAGPTAAQLAQARLAVVQAQEAVTAAQWNLSSALHPDVAYYEGTLDDALASLGKAQSQATITDIGPGLAGTLNSAERAGDRAEQRWAAAQAAEAGCGGCDPARLAAAQEAYDAAVNTLTSAQLQMQLARQDDTAAIDAAQEAVDQAGRNLAAAQAGPDQARVALYQAQLELAQAELATAQEGLERLETGPEENDVAAARAKVAAIQATLDKVRLVAPFDATVVAIDTHAGDPVSAGTGGMALADLSSLLVELNVSEVDVNRIVTGQEVSVTLDAAPGQSFTGRVSEVAYVGSANQGVVNFPVTVVIPDPDPAAKPGMTAAVGIVTDRREDVLLVPNRAIRVSGGQRSVIVLFEGQQFAVPVTIGLVGDSTSEVVDGGLKEGDSVVLNVGTTTTASAAGGFGVGGFIGGGGFRP